MANKKSTNMVNENKKRRCCHRFRFHFRQFVFIEILS